MSEFLLGSSYYPEWWDEKEWEEDFSKMEALGFNSVRMGEFAWSWYEPTEGNYNFEPMRRAVRLAAKHGIKVVMGTPTAVCPPWLYKKYPEVKGANEKGAYTFGGRKGLCLSSKVFLRYAKKITEEQAKALGNEENIIGWQLDNEPGFPYCDYSPLCNKEFRLWLKDKYKTVDNLNKAWFTMMWSNYYNDFDEIFIPVNASESGWTAEIQLDYRKFFSFTFNRLLSMEAEILRKYSPGRFLYTNWPGANWSVDCFEGEKYLDFAGWDNYVPQPNREKYFWQLKAGLEHSFDRRLSNGSSKFIAAEQPGYVNADTDPEVIKVQTWWNVANGAFATFFFEWRTPTGGAEQAYDSVMNRDKKVRPETEPVLKQLSSSLKKVYPLIDGAETNSDIGVIYSYINSWGTSGWSVNGFYDTEIFDSFGGFINALKVNADVLSPDDDLTKYKIIVMPNARIINNSQKDRLYSYVRNGGILVLNTECGTNDEYNKMLELNRPGIFSELCSAEVTGTVYADTVKENTGKDCFAEFTGGRKVQVRHRLDKIKTYNAEPIAVYTSGRLKGTAAVTINKYGAGYAVLMGTDGNDTAYYEALAEYLAGRFGIEPLLHVSDGILLTKRTKDGKDYILAVNMKDIPGTVSLKEKMHDALSDTDLSGEVKIKPYQVLMLHKA